MALLTACVGGPAETLLPAQLEFSVAVVIVQGLGEVSAVVRNTGGLAAGPVSMQVGAVVDASGSTVPGAFVAADPREIATMNPGDAVTVTFGVTSHGTLQPGVYETSIVARAGDDATAHLLLRMAIGTDDQTGVAVASLKIGSAPATARTGDVLLLPVEVRGVSGDLLQGMPVAWSVEPAGAGFIASGGQFVGYKAGPTTVIASAGAHADTLALEVTARGLTGAFTPAGRARETTRYSSDLWLYDDVAYVGTWGTRVGAGATTASGNMLHVWNVANPVAPTRTFSLEVDARTVNDVKIRADGRLAIITHEGSNDGLNGVTLLDLADRERPRAIGRFTSQLESGVHNAWIEGDFAYVVLDGVGNGLRILDVSDPSAPKVVSTYYAGESFLHDVYVRDGLAFLSHWNAGLVILDVGNGVRGGSPAAPVEVSRISDLGGQTHNAWYWPEAGYVFVGEEDFSTPGRMHVIDVRNLASPREVATYGVPGQTPHNFWLDESRGVLYLAWYANGVRALDVSGNLLGQLDRQGREIAGFVYNGGSGSCNRGSGDTCTWAPQLHRGLVWVSDMNEGLIALEPPR